MSGEKRRYTRVEDTELRRLRESDSRLRSLRNDLPERLNAVQQQCQRQMQQRLAPLEQRSQRQEQAISGLRTGLQSLERETQQRLKRQRQEFQRNLQASENRQQQRLQTEVSRLEGAMKQGLSQQRNEYLSLLGQQRQEYFSLVEEQDRKFTGLILEERQAREKGQQILQRQIDSVVDNLQAEREQKQQLAQDLLADVQMICQQMDQEYQHERFAPGKLAQLQGELELVQQNIEAGVSEAAIANAQQTYLKLADLRLELEQKEQEWQLYYQAVFADLQNLLSEVDANRQVELEMGEGEDLDKFSVEVDYWTQGRFSDYEQNLQQLHQQLVEGESSLTTEQLKHLSQQILDQEPQLAELLEQAKLSILGSQMRAEIAANVVDALEELGYSRVGDTYEGDDNRNTFVVKLKNIAGDEVVTVIRPEAEFGANSVSINTFSPTLVDEQATGQNAKAIFNLLKEAGIETVGELQCEQEADSRYQDLHQVQQRPQKQVQQNKSQSSPQS